MITAKEWVDKQMEILGMTEEERVIAWVNEPEHCKITEKFFKSIQDDAIKSVVQSVVKEV